MPQAVNEYLNTNNMSRVDKVKRRIIDLYIEDFGKIDPSGRAARLFSAIPSELSKNASRYQVASVLSDSERKNLDEVLEKMRESMTVNFAFHSDDPNRGSSERHPSLLEDDHPLALLSRLRSAVRFPTTGDQVGYDHLNVVYGKS